MLYIIGLMTVVIIIQAVVISNQSKDLDSLSEKYLDAVAELEPINWYSADESNYEV